MRIGIVNAVEIAVEALRRVVASKPEYQVAWIACTGAEALQHCVRDTPDLVLMDIVMPDMNGAEASRQIMAQSPCAILIVTATPDENSGLVFRAMGAGALDVTATPVLLGEMNFGAALLTKIAIIAKLNQAGPASAARAAKKPTATGVTSQTSAELLIAIGASTGGPIALAKILSQLQPSSKTAIVLVQHIDSIFADTLGCWLAKQVSIPVETIKDGDDVAPGCIYIAKTNDHLWLDERCRFRYRSEPNDYVYRPSVNVFFECVARHWKRQAIGVLLTGMGRDGAEGLLAMRRSKHVTIAQDQTSSVVYGMPRAAFELGAAQLVLPLDAIASLLNSRIESQT